MHKIASKSVIERISSLTGWNKTLIAEKIFGISLSNLGNCTRADRLDLYKLYSWASAEKLSMDWLLSGQGPAHTTEPAAAEPTQPYTTTDTAILNRQIDAAEEEIQSLKNLCGYLSDRNSDYLEIIQMITGKKRKETGEENTAAFIDRLKKSV